MAVSAPREAQARGGGGPVPLISILSPTPPPRWPRVPEGLHPPIKSSVPQRGNTYLQAP